MDFDKHGVGPARELAEHPVAREKRALRFHPKILPAEHREDREAEPVFLQNDVIASGAGGRKVGRPADALQPRNLGFEALLIPNMVAQREGIDPGIEHGPGHCASESRAGGGILSVGNHEIQPELVTQPEQAFRDDFPPWPAHDVANEQQFQHQRTVGPRAPQVEWDLG